LIKPRTARTVATLTAKAHKLYNFTARLDTSMIATTLPTKHLGHYVDVNPKKETLYTAA